MKIHKIWVCEEDQHAAPRLETWIYQVPQVK